MIRQNLTRRIVLGAFTVALALAGFGAAAAEKTEDYGNVDEFERICIEAGGTFINTRDGNTWCQHEDDSQTVCDSDGNDCHFIDMPPPTNPYSVKPIYGIWTPVTAPTLPVEETLIGGGVVVAEFHPLTSETQTVTPVETPLLAVDATQGTAPFESQRATAAAPSAPAAPAEVVDIPAEEPIPAASSEVVEIPVEAPVTLTEEPVAAEEPMAAEASAEQP